MADPTDHVGPSEGDRVVFTGYAPTVAELRGVLTTIIVRERDGERTGYVITLDDGGTVCAEPNQLHAEPRAFWDGS
jgi:hypothetical protein